jgi:hypothetical protein
MDESSPQKFAEAIPVARSRGKYVTLVLLLVWVAAVFAFTFFKFSGGGR